MLPPVFPIQSHNPRYQKIVLCSSKDRFPIVFVSRAVIWLEKNGYRLLCLHSMWLWCCTGHACPPAAAAPGWPSSREGLSWSAASGLGMVKVPAPAPFCLGRVLAASGRGQE